MQDYQVPQEDTSMDFQYWLDYAVDHQRHTPPAMQPCKNVDCANKSYALFCSEACRLVIERDDPEPDDDTFYSDGAGVLLGHRQLSDDQAAADGDLVAKACGYAQPVPAGQALPEAAASATVRLTIAGHADVLFTVRDMDETRLLQRLESLLQRFPVQAPSMPVRSPQGETGEDFCVIHQVRMKRNQGKDGSTWYSHRLGEGGFCKGKPKGQVRHG